MSTPLRMLSLATLPLAILAVATSADAADWKGTEETRDGVVHVMNPAQPMLPEVTLKPQELWRIGGDTDAEGEFFGVINQVTTDSDGNIYLLDLQLNEIKIFSPDGAYIRTIGREGEGPGEFRAPTGLFFVPSGEVGVLQAAPLKIVLLTKTGEPAGEYPTPKIEGDGFITVAGARLSGDQLVCLAMGNNFIQEKGTFIQTIMLRGIDSKGNIVASYYDEPRVLDFASPVFHEKDWDGIQNRWAVSPDGRVFGATSPGNYEITTWKPDGTVDRVIHAEHSPHKRTAEEHEYLQSIWSVFTRQAPGASVEIGDYDAAIATVYTRDDGSLWVMNSNGSHPKDGVLGTFDVFDRNGHFVKKVTIEGEGKPRQDGYFFVGDRLYVVTDFLGAFLAMQGGASGVETDEEAEPMSVICYKLDQGQIALK
ncbi:MAG: 6-bladed beta-propeller [Candidatus Eisenbacteria bacterium]